MPVKGVGGGVGSWAVAGLTVDIAVVDRPTASNRTDKTSNRVMCLIRVILLQIVSWFKVS